MTLKQFIDKWNGRKADFDGAYGGQCVDLFRFYNKEVLDIPQPKSVVGAADFWTNYDSDPVLNSNFLKIKNTPDFIPLPGDVMIWTRRAGGGFGHIAIIMEADVNRFKSFDQNWRALNVSEPTEHNYTNVYGVLRPVPSNPGNTTPEKTYTEEEMTKIREERDRNWDRYQTEKAEVEKQKTITAEKTKELRQFTETLAGKLTTIADKGEIIGGVDRLLEVEDQLSQAKRDLLKQDSKHQQERSEMQGEVDRLRGEIETLLGRIEGLEDRLQEQETQKELTNRFSQWIDSVLKLFKRK